MMRIAEREAVLLENPHIKLADGTRRGYMRVTLSRVAPSSKCGPWTPWRRGGAGLDPGTLVVEDGKVGAVGLSFWRYRPFSPPAYGELLRG